MRTRLALVVLCLAFAAPATADERLVTPGPVDTITAGGGWLAWYRSGAITLWRDGEAHAWQGPFVRALGTDRDGNPVALFERCDTATAGCQVRDGRVPEGPRRTLLDPPWESRSFDVSHGTLLITSRRPHPRRIFVKRPGERLRQIGDLRAGLVTLSTGAMTNVVGLNSRYRLFATGRVEPRRWHQLASWNEASQFRQELGTHRAIGGVSTDSSYAYWTEFASAYDEHGFVEGSRRTRILRVRQPGAGHRQVEAFTPPRQISRFAVTRGRLYYTDATDDAAVYEYRHPAFEPTGEDLPIEG
jgi:hypothetical protein